MKRGIMWIALLCLIRRCNMVVMKGNGNEIEVPKYNIHVEQNGMGNRKVNEVNRVMRFNKDVVMNMEIELEEDVKRFQAVIMKQNELIKKMIEVSMKINEMIHNVARKENVIL